MDWFTVHNRNVAASRLVDAIVQIMDATKRSDFDWEMDYDNRRQEFSALVTFPDRPSIRVTLRLDSLDKPVSDEDMTKLLLVS